MKAGAGAGSLRSARRRSRGRTTLTPASTGARCAGEGTGRTTPAGPTVAGRTTGVWVYVEARTDEGGGRRTVPLRLVPGRNVALEGRLVDVEGREGRPSGRGEWGLRRPGRRRRARLWLGRRAVRRGR